MLEELRFAIRCHGGTKRPALKRQCEKCDHHQSSEPCVVDSPNGIIQLRDVKKSPIMPSAPSQGRFRYQDPRGDSYRLEYRDTQA